MSNLLKRLWRKAAEGAMPTTMSDDEPPTNNRQTAPAQSRATGLADRPFGNQTSTAPDPFAGVRPMRGGANKAGRDSHRG